jgi:hypothetical protein
MKTLLFFLLTLPCFSQTIKLIPDSTWKEGDTIKSNISIYYQECSNCIIVDVPNDFQDLFLKKEVGLLYKNKKLTVINLR